jgi:hypothetical protein
MRASSIVVYPIVLNQVQAATLFNKSLLHLEMWRLYKFPLPSLLRQPRIYADGEAKQQIQLFNDVLKRLFVFKSVYERRDRNRPHLTDSKR